MSTNTDNAAIGAYETLKKRGFSPDDIAGLAEYLEERQRSTMQPVLDQIDAKFDQFRSEMVSRREAWIFIVILIGVAMVLPEGLEKIFDLIRSLQGAAEPPSASS